MDIFLYASILLFGVGSYTVGVRQMLQGEYSPSVFSRVIWLLLAVNSFAGVVLSDSSRGSVLLAGILLAGNAAVCLVSFWKGSREFGRLEYFCIAMLVVSAIVWLVFDAPLVNLAISLLAHFIGALPTYKKVWLKPESESTTFWSLFFIASILSIFASAGEPATAIMLPIYFAIFDGSLFALSLRRRR